MYTAAITIKGVSWQVDVATTPTEISQGLSGIASIGAYHGMLFDTGLNLASITINMQEMLFPLDVVFIKEDLTVAAVVLDAQPGVDFTGESADGIRYFLEVNAGELPAGLTEGDVVTLSGYSPPSGGWDLNALTEQIIIAGGLMAAAVIMAGVLK